MYLSEIRNQFAIDKKQNVKKKHLASVRAAQDRCLRYSSVLASQYI